MNILLPGGWGSIAAHMVSSGCEHPFLAMPLHTQSHTVTLNADKCQHTCIKLLPALDLPPQPHTQEDTVPTECCALQQNTRKHTFLRGIGGVECITKCVTDPLVVNEVVWPLGSAMEKIVRYNEWKVCKARKEHKPGIIYRHNQPAAHVNFASALR